MHAPDPDGPTLRFDLFFDDALFHKHARKPPPGPERAALKVQLARVLDALFAHDLDRWSLLEGTQDNGKWPTKPCITNDFIEKMHFLFADVVMREYLYDEASGTSSFRGTPRPTADAPSYLHVTAPTYVNLSAALFREKYTTEQPRSWSSGHTPLPFSQLVFLLSSVARLRWHQYTSDGRPKQVFLRKNTHTLPAHLHVPPHLLDSYMADVAEVRAEITQPPTATYVFDEDGWRVEAKKDAREDRQAEPDGQALNLTALLFQLKRC